MTGKHATNLTTCVKGGGKVGHVDGSIAGLPLENRTACRLP